MHLISSLPHLPPLLFHLTHPHRRNDHVHAGSESLCRRQLLVFDFRSVLSRELAAHLAEDAEVNLIAAFISAACYTLSTGALNLPLHTHVLPPLQQPFAKR